MAHWGIKPLPNYICKFSFFPPKADWFSSDNVAWVEGDLGVTTGGGRLVCCGGPALRPGVRDFLEQTGPFLFLCYFILSCESGLASFVAKAWNPADPLLLAPPAHRCPHRTHMARLATYVPASFRKTARPAFSSHVSKMHTDLKGTQILNLWEINTQYLEIMN